MYAFLDFLGLLSEAYYQYSAEIRPCSTVMLDFVMNEVFGFSELNKVMSEFAAMDTEEKSEFLLLLNKEYGTDLNLDMKLVPAWWAS